MTTTFTPTHEQEAIREAFATGDDTVVQAGAGTGKTASLKLLSNDTSKRGLYLAYNKAMQVEAAAEFPENIHCSTIHSLAFGPVGTQFRDRLFGARRTPPWEIAKALGVYNDFKVGEARLTQNAISGVVKMTVDRYCFSSDTEIQHHHVPRINGFEEYQTELQQFIKPLANKLWADLQNPTGFGVMQHDYYLKMWALTEPELYYDFILFDEAQDANALATQLVQGQSCQRVVVGDENQSLYKWRGAHNALSKFPTKHDLRLTQSFRFGQAVADEANKWLTLLDADIRLQGKGPDSVITTVPNADAVLCRSNAEVIAQAVTEKARGRSVAISGGTKALEFFAQAVGKLLQGKKNTHPDLMAFDNWGQVQEYSKSDEGRDLRVMVSLVDNHGVDGILAIIRDTVSEDVADVTISTVHKAKGLQWDKVKIGGDFRNLLDEQVEMRGSTRADLMLHYVAVTRAQRQLDRGSLAYIDHLLTEKGH